MNVCDESTLLITFIIIVKQGKQLRVAFVETHLRICCN